MKTSNKQNMEEYLKTVTNGKGSEQTKMTDALMLIAMQMATLTDVLSDLTYKTEVERRNERNVREKQQ